MRFRRLAALVTALVIIAHCASPRVSAELRAALLLQKFSGIENGFTRALAHPIAREDATVLAPAGPTRARMYVPSDAAPRTGFVLLHGVHKKSIDEPRLVRFAEALASAGYAVLTPELRSIADYRIDRAETHVIGAAARALSLRLGGAKVGLIGTSFAGGLALVTASEPEFRNTIGCVLAIGAHHDLVRVSRFYMTSLAVAPDRVVPTQAHDYGVMVTVYGHPSFFFPEAEVASAHQALKLWLDQDWDGARKLAATLTPPTQARVDALFHARIQSVQGDYERVVRTEKDGLLAASPSGRMANVTASVFLLHGEGDTVVPPTESEWLAQELGERAEGLLVTKAIEHVEMRGKPKVAEQLQLVDFIAQMITRADSLR
jgi:dienelactone hydrolase